VEFQSIAVRLSPQFGTETESWPVGTAQWEMLGVKIVLMGRAHQGKLSRFAMAIVYVTGTGIEVFS